MSGTDDERVKAVAKALSTVGDSLGKSAAEVAESFGKAMRDMSLSTTEAADAIAKMGSLFDTGSFRKGITATPFITEHPYPAEDPLTDTFDSFIAVHVWQDTDDPGRFRFEVIRPELHELALNELEQEVWRQYRNRLSKNNSSEDIRHWIEARIVQAFHPSSIRKCKTCEKWTEESEPPHVCEAKWGGSATLAKEELHRYRLLTVGVDPGIGGDKTVGIVAGERLDGSIEILETSYECSGWHGPKHDFVIIDEAKDNDGSED